MFGLRKSGPRVERIAPQDAVARQATGDLTLVDVRDISEVRASGSAVGAVHAPLMLLANKADPRHPDHDKTLSPDRAIALYCASGARSQMAGEMLLSLGYREVYNLGGLGAWVAAGGKVHR